MITSFSASSVSSHVNRSSVTLLFELSIFVDFTLYALLQVRDPNELRANAGHRRVRTFLLVSANKLQRNLNAAVAGRTQSSFRTDNRLRSIRCSLQQLIFAHYFGTAHSALNARLSGTTSHGT
jgi:hypothetical protein